MAEKLELPNEVLAGYVIEWIPRSGSGGSGWLKCHRGDGNEFFRHELTNGHLKTEFDFLALAKNLAQQNGLVFHCRPYPESGGITPVRGMFISRSQSHA